MGHKKISQILRAQKNEYISKWHDQLLVFPNILLPFYVEPKPQWCKINFCKITEHLKSVNEFCNQVFDLISSIKCHYACMYLCKTKGLFLLKAACFKIKTLVIFFTDTL